MAKLKSNEITSVDIQEYIDNYSDFSFEMQVLKKVKESGFHCEHGGTYDDPITHKPRQFDIRGVFNFGKALIYLSIEVKNLKTSFPLLISTIPRLESESFHDIIISKYDNTATVLDGDMYGHKIRVDNSRSFYEINKPVGKECDQIGRHKTTNEIVSNDMQIYDKWSQAINSSYDLLEKSFYLSDSVDGVKSFVCITIPVLVVPDNTLWQIHYNSDGIPKSNPEKTDHCSYFINKNFFIGENFNGIDYSISHIEICTITGLVNFLNNNLLDQNFRLSIFPIDMIDLRS